MPVLAASLYLIRLFLFSFFVYSFKKAEEKEARQARDRGGNDFLQVPAGKGQGSGARWDAGSREM